MHYNKYPSWFMGTVVSLDKEQNIKQTKGGVRYRVKRFGIDKPDELVENLLFFDCILPLTAGAGDGLKAKSVVLSVGDLVFGMHTDAPDHQRGVILGVLPRTQLINYDDIVPTEDLPTASGGDESASAQPSPVNLGVRILQPLLPNIVPSALDAVKNGLGVATPVDATPGVSTPPPE